MIPLKIVIVDDEEAIGSLLCGYLSQQGHDSNFFSDARQALSVIPETQPDVVITDIRMPGMGGIELLQAIRTQFPDIKVVLLSGFADTENAIAGVNLGAFAFLQKQVGFADVSQTLERVAQEKCTRTAEKLHQQDTKKNLSRLRTSLSVLQQINSLNPADR